MSDREKKLPGDIRDALSDILKRTQQMGQDEYIANRDVRLAVERLFLIVGEAAVRLRRENASAGKLANLQGAIWLRNFLVHSYDLVDDRVVWQTICDDVGPFLEEVESLLADRQ